MTEDASRAEYQLILDAQNGDFDAFRKIVLHYSNAMLSVSYSILGDFHEAQDVTQEVFVKCYKNLHTLKNPTRLGSWLYSIAYRTSLDFVKKRKSTLPYKESIAGKTNHVHAWLDQHVMQESIHHALQALEEKSKTAIILHYLSDWSMKEIGQFMNMSVSAVESRIRRAKGTLKLHLADDFEHYFHPYRLGDEFEQLVSTQVLKRMGHFYIPVTNKKRATDWFIYHFHLRISQHGNLLLDSEHELFLLECSSHSPTHMPVLTFSVADIDALYKHLGKCGVIIEAIETDDLFGKFFAFYDFDKNKYYAIEKN